VVGSAARMLFPVCDRAFMLSYTALTKSTGLGIYVHSNNYIQRFAPYKKCGALFLYAAILCSDGRGCLCATDLGRGHGGYKDTPVQVYIKL
jgi:hypothetical protein